VSRYLLADSGLDACLGLERYRIRAAPGTESAPLPSTVQIDRR